MLLQSDRTVWRKEIVSELLKHSIVFGKTSIEDILESAEKVENFVFQEIQQQSDKTD